MDRLDLSSLFLPSRFFGLVDDRILTTMPILPSYRRNVPASASRFYLNDSMALLTRALRPYVALAAGRATVRRLPETPSTGKPAAYPALVERPLPGAAVGSFGHVACVRALDKITPLARA
ncbi:MAG TPA: hypothetical protein VMF86_00515 [Stellaceae bacterium]|nr:hypothetical protein [Stellaceae bacterium]